MRLSRQLLGRPVKISITNGRLVPRKGASSKQINETSLICFFNDQN